MGVDGSASEAAFEAVVAQVQGRLLRTARLLVGPDGAEDLVQTSLASTWSRWGRLNDTSSASVEAYTRRVMASTATRWGRRRWKQEIPAERLPDDVAVPAQFAEERLALLAALGKLRPRWRAVIVLRYAEDLDENAVASLLDCPVGTVRSSAARGLARLRAEPELQHLFSETTLSQRGAR